MVEKANLEDTVFQAHGQRLHSLDSRNGLGQRLVVLGVHSGKELERQRAGLGLEKLCNVK